MHGSSFKNIHFVRSETLATRAKDLLKLNYNKEAEHCFILFLAIKHL